MRLILLHPAAMPDDSIAQWLAYVREDVGAAATITAGRDDFNEHSKKSGGMFAWCRGVAERYDGGLVPTSDGTIGRLTSDIVEGMLSRGKPVSMIDARKKVTRVSRVTKTTGKSRDGWVLS